MQNVNICVSLVWLTSNLNLDIYVGSHPSSRFNDSTQLSLSLVQFHKSCNYCFTENTLTLSESDSYCVVQYSISICLWYPGSYRANHVSAKYDSLSICGATISVNLDLLFYNLKLNLLRFSVFSSLFETF